MNTLPTISRRARWAIPVGAVALAGAVTAGSLISTAQASPELPLRTPAQLLASVAGRDAPPPALTGTVVETASLGLPQLPGTSNQNSITSLLAGSHTIKVWYADPQHIRLAVPVTLSETDVIRDGRQVSVWQSNSNTVTRMQVPAKASAADSHAKAMPSGVPLTPQQAASQALKAVGPSTRVTVDRTVTVAGQPAYQLVLSPRSSGSLIGRVSIAIDATRNVPLRVQVFARGAASPAIQVGFTSISFVKPAAGNFSFKTPAGAKVKLVNPTAVEGPRVSAKSRKAGGEPQVIGKGWLSVAVLPASDLAGVLGAGSASSAAGVGSQSVSSGSGESGAMAAAMMRSATAVHGAWGSGRLLHTSLVNVLMTSSGHVLVGAVTPAVLFAAAAQVK
ncbi:MAG: LolA family protein [Streptosporangiaceae bacterium]